MLLSTYKRSRVFSRLQQFALSGNPTPKITDEQNRHQNRIRVKTRGLQLDNWIKIEPDEKIRLPDLQIFLLAFK